MIRRFFRDGLHWVVIAGLIIGGGIYAMYFAAPAGPAPITRTVEQKR